MKKLLLLVLLCWTPAVMGQGTQTQLARSVYSGTGVPALNCKPGPIWRDVYIRTTTGVWYQCTAAPNTWTAIGGGGGTGDVVGPASALDNALARFDGLTGKLIQNSGIIVDDGDKVAIGQLTAVAQIDVLVPAGVSQLTLQSAHLPVQTSASGTNAPFGISLEGPIGGETSSATANRRGGEGGAIGIAGGPGGTQSGASSGGNALGGTGGAIDISAGSGGNATSVTGTVKGGFGGDLRLRGGSGGQSLTSTGGWGGLTQVLGGEGGSTSAAAQAGPGGGAQVVGGTGGSNSNAAGTSGNGGALTLDAGVAGGTSGGAASGVNGSISIGAANATTINIGNSSSTTNLLGTVVGAAGITNSAGANVVPKSDGTNLTASGISDDGSTIAVARTAIEIDSSTGTTVIGDVHNALNSTRITVDDLSALISLNGTVSLGDVIALGDGFDLGAPGTPFESVVIGNTSGNSSRITGTFTADRVATIPDATGTVMLNGFANTNLTLAKTITAGGTTGAQTIDKPSGSVNFAASASSLVVTNSLVDANSIITATAATDDTTCYVKNVVKASGSFTIKMVAACTAETRVDFRVSN